MGSTEAEKVLASVLEMTPKSAGASKTNYAVARNVFQEEIGRYGEFAIEYHFNQQTRDILLAHGRQDVAHALLNTSSLLEQSAKISAQLRALNVLALAVVLMLGAIVVKLYPQLFNSVELMAGLVGGLFR
jgi:hypothetical protein